MKRLIQATSLLLLGLALGSSAGCKKSGVDPAMAEAVAKLPGAADVWAALEKHNYDAAMAAILKVQQATPPEQADELRSLMIKARQKFFDASETNAAAADGLKALRAMTVGIR
jgi:hypothetical protein